MPLLAAFQKWPPLPALVMAIGAGLWAFHTDGRLWPVWLFPVVALLLILPALRWRLLLLPLAVCAVLGWTNWRAAQFAAASWPVLGDLTLTGTIVSLPLQYGEKIRLIFAPDQVSDAPAALLRLDIPARSPESFAYGQRWRMPVALSALAGPSYPGGFDRRFQDFWLGIRAQGEVQGAPQRLDGVGGNALMRRVHGWRAEIIEASNQALPRTQAGLVQALSIGVQNQIPAVQWDRFKDTGTAHLMVISGSHITLVAGLFFALTSLLWRLVPALVSRVPAQTAAILVMMLAALAYGLLAGMELPVQRAVIMIWVMAGALWLRRELRLWHSLSLAAGLVFVWQPGAVMEASFWLSFLAVAVIFGLLTLQNRKSGWWRQLVQIQIWISLAMLPVLALLFGQLPLLSPLANLLAIPVVELMATPLALLGALAALLDLDLAGRWCFHLAATLLQGLDAALAWLNQLPGVHWVVGAPTPWAWLSVAVGLCMLFLPAAWPARWLGLIAFAPLFFPKAPDIAMGEARVAVLDAGRASALVLHTRQHHLVWQADPDRLAGSARRVLAPYLRHMGVGPVDGWVLDLPHPRAQMVLPVSHAPAALWRNAGSPQPSGKICQGGEHWSWDGVDFEFLDPLPGDDAEASGCVLAVYGPDWQVLLFSRADDVALLRLRSRFGDGLRSDLLIMPAPGIAHLPPGKRLLSTRDPASSQTGAVVYALSGGAHVWPVQAEDRHAYWL